MLTTYGSLVGSWSHLRVFLPLLALAGAGVGLGLGLGLGIAILLEKVRDPDKEDLISRLPDNILCSILSQLTTKDAVRTSILSRRWRNLYVFLPKMSLTCPCTFKIMPSNQHCPCRPQYKLGFLTAMVPFRRPQGFFTVVDRFLQLRQGHKITSFQLSFCLGREVSCHLERWMHCLARLNIEELVLRFSCDPFIIDKRGNCIIRQLITFPFRLLSEASMLRSLSLFGCNLEPNFQGPFRSLMSLRLDAVPLINGEVQSILLSCPKLESLILTYCALPCKIFIGGSELELKFLTISSCFGVKEIDLCAGNLTGFETVCSSKIKIFPSYVPKLQQFCCRLSYYDGLPYIIGEVAKYMPQLESLYLESMIYEMYYLPKEGIPEFSNLRELYLLMDFKMVFDVQQLISVIDVCPLLQRFHLVAKGPTDCVLPAFTFSPLYHVHLKEVEFGGFQGLYNEIEFIIYLLASAVSLEQMLISKNYRYYIGEGRWEKSKERLFSKKQVEALRKLFQGKIASSTVRVILQSCGKINNSITLGH